MSNIYNVKSVVNISFSGKLLLAGVPNEIEVKTEVDKIAFKQLLKDKKLIDISKQLAEAEALAKAACEAEMATQEEAHLLEREQEPDSSEDDQSDEADEADEADEVVIDSLKELDQALEQPTETGGKSRKSKK